ncbi:MAG TPA: sulfotransferase domain-containing protein [Actinomycetota bacterium]|nr:sulfotransferase domain-containing protein [Actinomycetota bacterium]
MAGPASTTRRLLRHLGWIRSQGLARLIEEDELNPLVELRRGARRRSWSRSHPVPPGGAMPVFVLGVQRSGTNMVMRGFRNSPRFEVFNENDRRAFVDFRVRPVETLNRLVVASRSQFVVFKPLCDSHRAVELLEQVGHRTPPRALWVFRNVDDRARSALAKFGDANLRALRTIAAGQGDDLWQAGGLSPGSRQLLESFDYTALTAADAAALFWFLRNSLYFELGLDRRPDVLAVSYDGLVASPEPVLRRVCDFLGCPWDPGLSEHISRRSAGGRRLELDDRIRTLCDGLQSRFDALDGAAAARGDAG